MHRYLLIAMLVNFGAAIGFYIHNTFRHPPPLTSEAANQATSGSRAPPQPPSSLQLSSCFRMRSLKARSGKFRPPTTPDGSPVPEAAAASDTTAVLDQASAPPPAGSEGGAGELCQPEDASGSQADPKPKPTLPQQICSLGNIITAKVRGDVWEDENFRCVQGCDRLGRAGMRTQRSIVSDSCVTSCTTCDVECHV